MMEATVRQPLTGAAERDTFMLQTAIAKPAAELKAWLASEGHRIPYAVGAILPQASEGVVLARGWAEQGLVHLFRERDPADGRRWIFLIEKAGTGEQSPGLASPAAVRGSPSPAQRTVDRGDLRKLLSTLRSCAERGRACPSDSEIARELVLGVGERGRKRAGYLMKRLTAEGAIAVENRGCNTPRVVTVVAQGRARGRSTRA